jgi:nucleotide-binding universal stress UspA family protein
MYKRILVPVDGSETSKRGLEHATQLATAWQAKLELVHVVNEIVLTGGLAPTYPYDPLIDVLRDEGKKILQEACAYVRAQGLEPETQLVEAIGGRAARVIVDEARRWLADLIVMGTHGRRGVARLALGSDAELVLRHSSIPVLVVPHG